MIIDNARVASDLLGVTRTRRIVDTDGIVTMRVGIGSTEARVYAPNSRRGAERNLNFAVANLAAYLDWEKREAERLLEEEAKARAERESRDDREEIERRALAAFNDQSGTKHIYWTQAFYPRPLDQTVVDAWSRLVRTIDASAPKGEVSSVPAAKLPHP